MVVGDQGEPGHSVIKITVTIAFDDSSCILQTEELIQNECGSNQTNKHEHCTAQNFIFSK